MKVNIVILSRYRVCQISESSRFTHNSMRVPPIPPKTPAGRVVNALDLNDLYQPWPWDHEDGRHWRGKHGTYSNVLEKLEANICNFCWVGGVTHGSDGVEQGIAVHYSLRVHMSQRGIGEWMYAYTVTRYTVLLMTGGICGKRASTKPSLQHVALYCLCRIALYHGNSDVATIVTCLTAV